MKRKRLTFECYELNVSNGKSWLRLWTGKTWIYVQPEDIRRA